MEQKKTLIILSPGFAKNEEDTTCLPAHQAFVRAMNRNFPSLQIVILAFHYPLYKKHYEWFGNDIISFNGAGYGKLKKSILLFHIYRALKKLRKQNNVMGLLSFWCTECALVGKYFAQKKDLRHFIWITGQDAKKNNPAIKRIKPQPDELIAMSDFLSDTFFNNYGIKPAHVIPNGIDVNIFYETEMERTIDIMGAGSLIPLKQYDIFIEVITAIKKIKPFIKIVLCGGGSEEKRLKEISRQYGLEKNLLFMGKQPHTEVIKLMQQTKIFLHPSSYEGFSTVCLEALYAGAHVISFIQPMHHSIEHWHIVKTKEEMIEKLLNLLSASNAEYAPKLPYSVDTNAKEMMKLFCDEKN